MLVASNLKSTGVLRFQWLLPASAHLPQPEAIDPVPEAIFSLANAAINLSLLTPDTHFDSIRVNRTYRRALRIRNLLTCEGKGRMRLREIGSQYAHYLAPLRQIEELRALPATEEEAAREVSRLVYELRRQAHPLRHLALIGWLFGDMQSFLVSYRSFGDIPLPGEQDSIVNEDNTPSLRSALRQQLLGLVEAGRSPTGAARQIGVDPVTGMAWAASAGISTSKRPSVIKNDRRLKMVAALRHGASKKVTATIGGVSIESVTRLLRTEVGLADAWRDARFANTQRAARRRWLRVIADNPLLGAKAVRMLEPAAFAWLYRWNRDWLDAQAEQLARVRNAGGLHVDWDARDLDLAKEVLAAGLDIAKSASGVRIKLWQIYQRIPQLKAKLSKLDRLPLTREMIRRALKAPLETPTLI